MYRHRDPLLSIIQTTMFCSMLFVLIQFAPQIVGFYRDNVFGLAAETMEASTGKQAVEDRTEATEEPAKGASEPFEMPWEILGFVSAGLVVTGGAGVGGAAAYRSSRRRREVTSNLADRWKQALAKHDRVKDEYAAIRLDPVAALDHMALWDITDPFTERFTTAMGQAGDLRSVQGESAPKDESVIATYAAAVEKCVTRWNSARTHARQHGLDVLAKADRSAASQARKLLVMSTNPGATDAERALAATKANALLDRLRDIAFPDETRQAILAPAFKQIEAGPSIAPARPVEQRAFAL